MDAVAYVTVYDTSDACVWTSNKLIQVASSTVKAFSLHLCLNYWLDFAFSYFCRACQLLNNRLVSVLHGLFSWGSWIFQYSSLLVEHSGCLIKEWWKLWRFTSLCFLDWIIQSAEEFYIPSVVQSQFFFLCGVISIPDGTCLICYASLLSKCTEMVFLIIKIVSCQNFSTLPKKSQILPVWTSER